MGAAKPWLGHSGKLRCRRKIQRPKIHQGQVEQENGTTTRCGRQVRKPARFLLVADQMVNQRKVGEVVGAAGTRETLTCESESGELS